MDVNYRKRKEVAKRYAADGVGNFFTRLGRRRKRDDLCDAYAWALAGLDKQTLADIGLFDAYDRQLARFGLSFADVQRVWGDDNDNISKTIASRLWCHTDPLANVDLPEREGAEISQNDNNKGV